MKTWLKILWACLKKPSGFKVVYLLQKEKDKVMNMRINNIRLSRTEGFLRKEAKNV